MAPSYTNPRTDDKTEIETNTLSNGTGISIRRFYVDFRTGQYQPTKQGIRFVDPAEAAFITLQLVAQFEGAFGITFDEYVQKHLAKQPEGQPA